MAHMPENYADFGMVSDYDIDTWEKCREELLLYVCSQCGLICNEMVEHGDCSLQDWWHLNARCEKRGGS